MLIVATFALLVTAYVYLNRPPDWKTIVRVDIEQTEQLPKASAHIFLNKNRRPVGGMLFFGSYPIEILPHRRGFKIGSRLVESPNDGHVYVVTPSLELVMCELDLHDLVEHQHDHSQWGKPTHDLIMEYSW